MTWTYRVLGPMQVCRDGAPVPVPAAKRRILLSYLLMKANEPVIIDDLVEEIWAGSPPASATANVRTYVAGLRRSLSDGAGASPILARPGGYELRVASSQLDVSEVRERVLRARAVAGSVPFDAARLYELALEAWRGESLADVAVGPALAEYAARLEEERRVIVEDLVELKLALGRVTEIVPLLRRFVTDNPLRERAQGQLMLALYRCGDASASLEVFARARAALVDQLGLEPGPDLVLLHRAILERDPALDPAAPAVTLSTSDRPVPFLTPPDVADFTGRAETVARCVALLEQGHATLRVLAVSGPPGVGKSALAVHVAHRLRARFPDGQLYADLGGDRSVPARPGDVLGLFLRALGVPPARLPEDPDERLGLLRTELAERRVLVVLDNAADAAQVRALLPSAGGCAVLVTGRARLAGLAGAAFVDLDTFTPAEAGALFAAVVSPARAGDTAAVAEIVRLCGFLPLAVRIAAARAAGESRYPLAALAGRLRDERRRLAELTVGDLDVRASLATADASLPPEARRLLRILAALDLPDVTEEAVPDGAVRQLVAARLLEDQGPDATGRARYRFHDLVRLFAVERAECELPAAERRAALREVCARLLARATDADARLERRTVAPIPYTATVPTGDDDPVRWFEAERHVLVAAVHRAARAGLADAAWRLAAALHAFCELYGYYADAVDTHRAALAACRAAGVRLGVAVLLRNLADLHVSGRGFTLDDKLAWASEARDLLVELREPAGAADAWLSCADVHRARGEYEEALRCLAASLDAARQVGYRLGELHVHQMTGMVHRARGRTDLAGECAEAALAVAREVGSPRDESVALGMLGLLAASGGDHATAAERFARGHAVATASGDPLQEAFMLAHLGSAYATLGRRDAASVLGRALVRSREQGSAFGEALALLGLGELAVAQDRPDEAVEHLDAAGVLWRRCGTPFPEARTLRVLGSAHAARGDVAGARDAWTAARDLFHRLGNDDAAHDLDQLLKAEA
ncbi:SARP family transcriptional regulator [Virgisporangium aliadipatigenens]|uniref:SARP family transcriptional regulator n=1 Tax=Virgisporangium aliadipatigenens TaxID=741659 RepID=A0A8J3YRZ6_9ACTN|nr:BTAD domain-containing putative transcriptional regulator [Virgisporangium aliadipatigenens]GIJ49323.1 SARP family transcriptional regulator [Virgisporangium aliadipatigenens]